MKQNKVLKLIGILLTLLPEFLFAQSLPEFRSFSKLPDPVGRAGMFAGKSNGVLFCMGGANFPEKKPWEGGKKIWHNAIFRLNEEQEWVELKETMPARCAYGISVEYKKELILVGGNDENEFKRDVIGLTWNGRNFVQKEYPPLPVPLANMAGALVGTIIVVAGGNSGFTSPGLNGCYALDLTRLKEGWIILPSWPGLPRNQPVGGSYGNKFYLFGGEVPGKEQDGSAKRVMLLDAYMLSLKRIRGILQGNWEPLSNLPKSVTAAANPVPVNSKGDFLFWGGVDSMAAQHKNPATHPGNDPNLYRFSSRTREWKQVGTYLEEPARVTLPSVLWKGYWLYISGEVRPGVRTNAVTGFKNN